MLVCWLNELVGLWFVPDGGQIHAKPESEIISFCQNVHFGPRTHAHALITAIYFHHSILRTQVQHLTNFDRGARPNTSVRLDSGFLR